MIKAKTVCNVCAKTFDETDEAANFTFRCCPGYGSKYDLTRIHAHICVDCFDKLMDSFIPACKISPVEECSVAYEQLVSL